MMAQQTWGFPSTVESVVSCRTNGPLIAAAAVLHIPDGATVLDVTYGRGRFWTDFQPAVLLTHDLRIDGVDCRDLPEDDESIDVVVFDPPYIAVSTSTSTIPDFNDRYGVADSEHAPRTMEDLESLFRDGIAEAARVVRPGGVLMVKCMDFVTSGRYQAMRHLVVAEATSHGLVQVDEFVHHSGTGPIGEIAVQRTSRRAHSFLCVFRKRPLTR